jgi:hypothetical protein
VGSFPELASEVLQIFGSRKLRSASEVDFGGNQGGSVSESAPLLPSAGVPAVRGVALAQGRAKLRSSSVP